MPPVLSPSKSKVDGLAFLGLSLSRRSEAHGHPDSQTHQTAFDFNEVLDRRYDYIFSSNDDGWLAGGGEPGPPKSYKLAAPDSAHVEILRIGTYKREWGGITADDVVAAIQEGKIMIPEMSVVPTAVMANHDNPPEVEIRFDLEPACHDPETSLPVNWQLRFLHNQLFRHFEVPSRFCPGAFHSTILRKAEFRSPAAEKNYFDICDKAVKRWRMVGPKPLLPLEKPSNIQTIVPKVVSPEKQSPSTNPCSCDGLETILKVVDDILTPVPDPQSVGGAGVWLFTDRKTITHHFEPNFLPPYDTPEKRQIIYAVLGEDWDPTSLSWKVTSGLPKPRLLLKGERGELPEARDDVEDTSNTRGRFRVRKMRRSNKQQKNKSVGAEGVYKKKRSGLKTDSSEVSIDTEKTNIAPAKKSLSFRVMVNGTP